MHTIELEVPEDGSAIEISLSARVTASAESVSTVPVPPVPLALDVGDHAHPAATEDTFT